MASSHSGLIPLKTTYSQDKRGIALGYRSKKNFINLQSAAFVKIFVKIFRKRYHSIFSNFAIIEAVMAGTNSLKRFLKKTRGTEKHKAK